MLGATEKQIKFATDLLAKKNLWSDPRFFDAHNAMDAGEFDQAIERIKAQAFVSKAEARKLITWLLSLPDKPEEDKPDPKVAAPRAMPLEGRSFSDDELNKILAALGVYIGETDGDVETFDLYNKVLGYLGAEPIPYPDYLADPNGYEAQFDANMNRP